jgi:hypothetical protein
MSWVDINLADPIDGLTPLPPDIMLEIAQRLTYLDIISMCRANRTWYYTFGVDNFGQIWQFFYRQAISAYRVPCDLDMGTPGRLMKEFSAYFMKTRFLQAARRGYDQLARTYLEALPKKYWFLAINEILQDITRCGYDDMLEWLISDDSIFDYICAGVAERGNWDLLDRLQHSPFHRISDLRLTHGTIYGAARGNHREVLQSILHLDFNSHSSIRGAAIGGHRELLWELLQRQPNYSHAIFWAAVGGHADLIPELLNHGATKVSGLCGAAQGGHLDLVKYFIHTYGLMYNSRAYHSALYHAAGEGHILVVDYILTLDQFPSDIIQAAFDVAAQEGHLKVVERLRCDVSLSPHPAIEKAEKHGYPELARFIQEWSTQSSHQKTLWATLMTTMQSTLRFFWNRSEMDVL